MNDERAGTAADERGLDRILSLSDGIFAFALTLLVLSLTVPVLSGERTSLNLLSSLSNDFNAFVSYGVSFFVISTWWVAHHRTLGHVKRYDSSLMWMNLFFLLFITIIPFLTELVNTYGDIQAAVIIYDGSQLLGGLTLSALWRHVSKKHFLIEKKLTDEQIKIIKIRTLIPSFVFLGAIGVSFITSAYSNFTLFAMFPAYMILARKSKLTD